MAKVKSSILIDVEPPKGRQMTSLPAPPPGSIPFQLRTNSTVLTLNNFQILPPKLQKNLNYYGKLACDFWNAIRLSECFWKHLCVKQTDDRTQQRAHFWADVTVWRVFTRTVSSELKGRKAVLGVFSPAGALRSGWRAGWRTSARIYLASSLQRLFLLSLMYVNVSDTLCLLQVINHLLYEVQPRDFPRQPGSS